MANLPHIRRNNNSCPQVLENYDLGSLEARLSKEKLSLQDSLGIVRQYIAKFCVQGDSEKEIIVEFVFEQFYGVAAEGARNIGKVQGKSM